MRRQDGVRRVGSQVTPSRGTSRSVPDGVDQEAVELVLVVDQDIHRPLGSGAVGYSQASAQVDRGDDAAAQVEEAGDLGTRQRHGREGLRAEDVLHRRDRNGDLLACDGHGHELAHADLGRGAAPLGRDRHQAAFLRRSWAWLSASRRAPRSSLPT